ncbi:MAG: L-rhamnose isomerase [Planctomycetaceae bacterium]|jgi:L-rhamnose isomerase|nr:L-rhamnose isomerase [Planctomycetaceae bacterium]
MWAGIGLVLFFAILRYSACVDLLLQKRIRGEIEMSIERSYELARERYLEFGVDVSAALARLSGVKVSLQCWQGDDVGGFENSDGLTGGGILATGNYPGKAHNADELRADADVAFSLIPGKHKFSLHAIYLENGGKKVDRDQIGVEHFQNWIDWAKLRGLGLDFNPTYFSHSLSADGFTLSSADSGKREFWIRHGIACRQVAEAMGKQLGMVSVVNFWMPDGFKDIPVDRLSPRKRMAESLDRIFSGDIDAAFELDALESKLFGIGSETYVVGSHEFCLGYVLSRGKLLCLDAGHFHPTEMIADKLSSVSLYSREFLLHVSRPVRWDSDHVVIWNDDLRGIAEELVRNDLLGRVHIGLDFFDATINRIAAWVIGTRSMLKAILAALLEPIDDLRRWELEGDYTRRLATLEELKSLPFGAIWDYYCKKNNVPIGTAWLDEIKKYEEKILTKRER